MKRSSLLKILTALLALALLVACGSTQSKPNETTKEKQTYGENSTGDTAPKEQITITMIDWSDSDITARTAYNEKYMSEHPNIKIEYSYLTIDQYKNTILTAVMAGEAPDIFPVPVGMKLSTVVAEGWYLPITKYLSDEFKEKLADNVLVEGVNMINGEVYTLSEKQSVMTSGLYYNKKLVTEAGIDPNSPPKTLDELREYAKKITQAGKGKYYGIIDGGKQVNRLESLVIDMSAMAGSGLRPLDYINYKTGTPDFNQQALYDVLETIKNMVADGSFHPSTMSISAPEARALFGQGEAGMICQGYWCVGTWRIENPDLDFGVWPLPAGKDGVRSGGILLGALSPWCGINAKSEHPDEAVDYFLGLYDEFYQSRLVMLGNSSIVKGINEKYIDDPVTKDYFRISDEITVIAPDKTLRNPETVKIDELLVPVTPNPGQIIQGVMAASVTDYKKAFADYSENMQKALDTAISEAKKSGANVSWDDFKFPNFNLTKSYTDEDYAELK
jgi:multiple sugar transport system substrate-binding protein